MSRQPRLDEILNKSPGGAADRAAALAELIEAMSREDVPPELAEAVKAKLEALSNGLNADEREKAALAAAEEGLDGIARLLRGEKIAADKLSAPTERAEQGDRVRALFELPRPDPCALSDQSLPSGEAGAARLVELMDRIERFKSRRHRAAKQRCQWRTDSACNVTEGFEHFGSRTPFSLKDLDFECRKSALRAIDQLQPLRALRVSLEGDVRLLSAEPGFTKREGAFAGFHGQLSACSDQSFFDLPADRLAEVAHEVLTPLNAIVGYAQMIEQEILGPAPETVRRGAQQLLEDAGSLMTAVNALGEAAAFGREGRPLDSTEVVLSGPLLEEVAAELRDAASARGVKIALSLETGAAMICSRDTLRRSLLRLGIAVISFADSNETITLSAAEQSIAITQPQAIRGRSMASLLRDPPLHSAQNGVPLLGLAFSLRLVRRLLEGQGGSLDLRDGRIALSCDLPEGSGAALAS